MAEPDDQEQEDYSAAAEIARGMQPNQGPMDMVEMSRALGYGSYGHVMPSEDFLKSMELFQKRQAYAAGGGSQQKPLHPDAQFYSSVGDLAGAIAIQKTKGQALFTFGEEFDFGSRGLMAIVPSGEMNVVDRSTNTVKRAKIADYAYQQGIKTVPFRGGDNNAATFRGMLTKTRTLFDSLDKLEKSYEANWGYIGKLNPSGTSTNAERLETSILMDSMAIITGTQTIGGNTSNVDLDIIKTLVPKAASSYFQHMKGNEKLRLEQLREHIFTRLMAAAEANGISFRPVRRVSQTTEPSKLPKPSGISQ